MKLNVANPGPPPETAKYGSRDLKIWKYRRHVKVKCVTASKFARQVQYGYYGVYYSSPYSTVDDEGGFAYSLDRDTVTKNGLLEGARAKTIEQAHVELLSDLVDQVENAERIAESYQDAVSEFEAFIHEL